MLKTPRKSLSKCTQSFYLKSLFFDLVKKTKSSFKISVIPQDLKYMLEKLTFWTNLNLDPDPDRELQS